MLATAHAKVLTCPAEATTSRAKRPLSHPVGVLPSTLSRPADAPDTVAGPPAATPPHGKTSVGAAGVLRQLAELDTTARDVLAQPQPARLAMSASEAAKALDCPAGTLPDKH
ncbi:UNVERIFIED_CONTAM: hypothetical protein K2H54_045913 [Gekko kuhli]